MKNINSLILIFAIAFTLFFIGPALLGGEFAPYPLLTLGDVLDLLTPIFLMPLYYCLFRAVRDEKNPIAVSVTFVVLSAIWVEGQGMHLGANAIGHHLSDFILTDAYKLTYVIDEVLSHYIWHIGIVGMALFLFYVQWKNPFAASWKPGVVVILAAVLHGLTLFLIFIEGGTCPLGVLFCVIVVSLVIGWGRTKLRSEPIVTFFFIACLLTLILIVGWTIAWGGCLEISETPLSPWS